MEIKAITEDHYAAIKKIYVEGIATGHATFQTDAPAWEDWDKSHLSSCRIAVFEEGKMAGWAALTPVSNRCVYAGVAEVSIYIAEQFRGKGTGSFLLGKLIEESEKHGLWTLQAGTFPENSASIKLHEKFGFRQVGYREKVGNLNGIWRDTVLLERRSKVAGI
jgi:L-amino acid N-acyltransferase YncA